MHIWTVYWTGVHTCWEQLFLRVSPDWLLSCSWRRKQGRIPKRRTTVKDLDDVQRKNVTWHDPFLFLTIKPTRCTNFSNLFLEWNSTYVSDSSSVHHQEFFTVHTAVLYVVQVCWELRAGSGWNYILILVAAVSKPVWHIPLLCVQWKTPDDGQKNCPKHV